MIRLSGGGSVRVYTSPTRTLPNFNSGYTSVHSHTEDHDLGSIPDRVDILFPGDATESAAWYGPKGPHAQAVDLDYGMVPGIGEIGFWGASCNHKSSTQFRVVFHRLWSSQKVYFKAYLLGGDHRAS
jgi:hypothetical protein